MQNLLIIKDNISLCKILYIPIKRDVIYFRVCFIFRGKAKTIIKCASSK